MKKLFWLMLVLMVVLAAMPVPMGMAQEESQERSYQQVWVENGKLVYTLTYQGNQFLACGQLLPDGTVQEQDFWPLDHLDWVHDVTMDPWVTCSFVAVISSSLYKYEAWEEPKVATIFEVANTTLSFSDGSWLDGRYATVLTRSYPQLYWGDFRSESTLLVWDPQDSMPHFYPSIKLSGVGVTWLRNGEITRLVVSGIEPLQSGRYYFAPQYVDPETSLLDRRIYFNWRGGNRPLGTETDHFAYDVYHEILVTQDSNLIQGWPTQPPYSAPFWSVEMFSEDIATAPRRVQVSSRGGVYHLDSLTGEVLYHQVGRYSAVSNGWCVIQLETKEWFVYDWTNAGTVIYQLQLP